MANNQKLNTKQLTMAAILTALVIIFQSFITIKFGIFAISLVLIPIVIGASTCGAAIGAWLGFVFGMAVLLSGDATPFMQVNIPGTIFVVLLKGTLSGLFAGLVYKATEKINILFAVFLSAITSAVTNTGIFLLGCLVFFMDLIKTWSVGAGFGDDVGIYMIVGLVGVNFLIELGINIVLSPVVVRLLKIRQKQ